MALDRTAAIAASLVAVDARTLDTAMTARTLGVSVQVLRAWTTDFGFPRSHAVRGGRKQFLAEDVRALAGELTCFGSPAEAISRAAALVEPDPPKGTVLPFPPRGAWTPYPTG